jgi:hypothetical protein
MKKKKPESGFFLKPDSGFFAEAREGLLYNLA